MFNNRFYKNFGTTLPKQSVHITRNLHFQRSSDIVKSNYCIILHVSRFIKCITQNYTCMSVQVSIKKQLQWSKEKISNNGQEYYRQRCIIIKKERNKKIILCLEV